MIWNRIGIAIMLVGLITAATARGQQRSEQLQKIEQSLQSEILKILCVNEKFATAGQPKDSAFAKLSANGFRSVLNLRTNSEGVDLEREQSLVEAAGMRYISIPVVSSAPKPEQVDEFIKAVQDPASQPMLIHCGSANRVGAFWMIYLAVVQKWPEDKALEEATRIGLVSPVLKAFAHEQIASRKK